MTETQYSVASDHLNSSTTPKDDDKLKFSTLSSISESPFNTISTTASDKTLADESLVPKDLLDSVFSTFSDNSVGDIDLSLNVSRSSLSGNTVVEKHNSVSTKHNSTGTNTNSINKKHNSGLSKNNYESSNKEESKVTQGPRRDFRTPTSSFLLEDRFNSADLEKLNLEASEANIQVPIIFSSVSLNLDI
ncbi:4117_t:CDS:2, partial [Acaulospora morrowiae]